MRIPLLSVLLLFLFSCAQQVSPNGGAKDETPPKLMGSKPENKSILFNEEKITIKFDEYVQIKDPSQIVISPFIKDKPTIEANGKTIEVTFLKNKPEPNTTYTINFGNSIADNHEGTTLKGLTYVFSTGDHLDSNNISGKVINALTTKAEKDIVVALYRFNHFHDSIIQKKYPVYFSRSSEEGTFKIENLPEDTFYLIAFKDANSDNKYQKDESIAFTRDTIYTSGNKKDYLLHLYEPYKYKDNTILDTAQRVKGRYDLAVYHATQFSVEPEINNEKVVVQWSKNKNLIDSCFIYFENYNDTSNRIIKINTPDTSFHINYKPKARLKLPEFKVNLFVPSNPDDSIHLVSNTPLHYNPESIQLKQDTVYIKPKYFKQTDSFSFVLFHPFQENQNYTCFVGDSTLTNLFGKYNKKLEQGFIKPDIKDFGNLLLTIENMPKTGNYIIQLFDIQSNSVVYEWYNPGNKQLILKNIKPGEYTIRVVADTNNNKEWDRGIFQKRLLPERTFMYDKSISIKAYWDIEQSINITEIIKD